MNSHPTQVEAYLQSALERIPAPAQAVALIHHGKLIYTEEIGDATAQSVFRLGTLTHALTAYAVDTLLHDHQHADINALQSAVRVEAPNHQPITPHHLLTHTAGLGTARSLWALIRNDSLQEAGAPCPDLATHYHGKLKGIVPPDEKWCFSNDGYALLGEAIAQVSGMSYPDAMQQYVFSPLNMRHAAFNAPSLSGYKRNGKTPIKPMDAVLLPALGGCASLEDLIAFVAALFDRETLMTPHLQRDDRLPNMGYGLRVQTANGQKVAWSNGQITGYSSAICIAPESQTAVILLANSSTDGALGTIARRAVLTLIDAQPQIQSKPNMTSKPLNLTGYYAPSAGLLTNIELWGAYGGGLRVQLRGGQWRIHGQMNPTESHPLQATEDEDAFRVGDSPHAPMIIFADEINGQPHQLTIGLFTLYRRGWWHSLGAKLIMAIGLLFLLFMVIVGGILAL
jgi:CubicO group peptidase (beta-lactamase class C family)